MTALRKGDPVLVYGDYQIVQPEHKQIYAYIRKLDNVQKLVLLNFSNQAARIDLHYHTDPEDILINNYASLETSGRTQILKPYQAVILNIEQ